MIKLKDLLAEVSLHTGNAAENSMEDFFNKVSYKVLPKKYAEVSDWIGQEPKDSWNDNWKKEYERAKELSFVDSTFKGIINSKLPLIISKGGYELRYMKRGNRGLTFHLCDPNAKFVYEYFIGVIEVYTGNDSYRFTPSKAFGLKVYQINWSNVATEHMGRGLGKLMYTMVYEYVSGLGAALVSDTTLYQGSQKMWIDYIPTIASYFGIVMDDIFFPIDKSEMVSNGRSLMGDNSVSQMVAMQSPPTLIRKIEHNFKGLSFSKGEYGVVRVNFGVNTKLVDTYAISNSDNSMLTYYSKNSGKRIKEKNPVNRKNDFTYFSNLVDESSSIWNLFKKFEKFSGPALEDVTSFGSKMNLQAVVFAFSNANVIVKKSGGKLVMVAI